MSASSKTATNGIIAVLIIAVIIAINFLVGVVNVGNVRLDLTEDGLYTLSQGTQNIISHIKGDEPVSIKFYSTSDDRVMPNVLKPHARSVEDLLLEFAKQSHDNITLEVIHPNPDTDEEDKAKEDEIRALQVNQEGDHVYLGMSVQCLDRKEILPFLSPEDATSLEYDVARAIAKVIKPTKAIIGVMSAMPIAGAPMMPFQQQRGPEAWAIIQQLKADYEVRDLPVTADKIDSDITVLLLVHPADITESTEFAIDQYLLSGGNVIAFVDPQSLLAQAMSTQPNPMSGQPGNMINTSSDLQNLFKAWGITYKKDMVLADMNYRGQLQGRLVPTALQLPGEAINQTDRVTAGLQSFTLMNAGSFGVDKKEGLEAITLATSSEASEMIDTAEADKLRRQPMINFSASGKKQVLGVRLTGKFKTAFPNGRPAAPPAPKEAGGAEQDATAPATTTASEQAPEPASAAPAPAPAAAPAAPVTVTTPPIEVSTVPTSVDAAKPATAPAPTAVEAAPKPAPAPAPVVPAPSPAVAPAVAAPAAPAPAPATKNDNSLKESKDSERTVILFSDADMLYDAFCLRQGDLGVGLVTNGGNLPMVLNAVEVLVGGGDLIQVRNRKSAIRPFTKLKEMREGVEEKYRPQLVALAAERQKLAEQISKAQPQVDLKKGTLIVDEATMKSIKEMQKNSLSLERQERSIRKEVNKEVEAKKTWLTVLNIAAVPLLIFFIGLILAVRRRTLTAAA